MFPTALATTSCMRMRSIAQHFTWSLEGGRQAAFLQASHSSQGSGRDKAATRGSSENCKDAWAATILSYHCELLENGDSERCPRVASPSRSESGDGAEVLPPQENLEIVSIAKKYNKSPAQIILRWLIQRNIVAIPKSVTPARIVQNAQVT
jgi:hypothetical protein